MKYFFFLEKKDLYIINVINFSLMTKWMGWKPLWSHQMSTHKILSNLYPKCPKCLRSSTLVSQPVQHVLVKMFLVTKGTCCLIKMFLWCWPKMSAFVLSKIKLELRGIFLLVCDFFVGYCILCFIYTIFILHICLFIYLFLFCVLRTFLVMKNNAAHFI